MKKTIFTFIGGYLPAENYGGPVTTIANIVENLSDEFEFRIVTANHDLKTSVPLQGIHDGWNDVKGAKVLYLKDSEFKKSTFENILREYKADLVYLSGIFNYSLNIPAYRAARKLEIPILLAPRGELLENALKLKKYKKIPYIFVLKMTGCFNNMIYQATSEEERQAITEVLNIDREKIYLLPNMHGISVSKTERKKESGKLKAVFLSRIAKKKNLLFAIDIVTRLKGDITFDIYGPVEDAEYWKACCKLIESVPENIKINYCSKVKPKDAKYVYADYDCLFFPTLSENYGHVIVEAMFANCPIVISKGVTPWDDVGEHGGFVSGLDDEARFLSILQRLTDMNAEEHQSICDALTDYTKAKFNTDELREQYSDMFKTAMGQ